MSAAVRTSQSKINKIDKASLPEQAALNVGTRLRQLRKSEDVTLVDLAQESGVDIATISRIETGKMTGTLESHVRLATALGVKLTDLYAGIEEARTKDAVTVQPPGKRSDVYIHESGKSSISLLTNDVLKKKLMPVLISIEPGGNTQTEEAKVGTEQFVYVLEGTLDAKIGEKTHPLRRGSSLYFDASVPHQFRNIGSRTAQCLSIVTPPVL